MDTQTIASYLVIAARLLLALPLCVFGLNEFLGFIERPPAQGMAGQFLGGLAAAGYFFPLLGLIEVAVGLLLLVPRLVPLALVMLTPVSINALAFHIFLAPHSIGPIAFVLTLQIFLVWTHRSTLSRLVAQDSSGPETADSAPHRLLSSPRQPSPVTSRSKCILRTIL